MTGAETWFGWIAIGLAASLAGMIWPFRRGAIGVVANVLAAVVGAVCVPLASYLVLPLTNGADRHEAPARLVLSAVGALFGLAVAHIAWMRHAADRRPSRAAR